MSVPCSELQDPQRSCALPRIFSSRQFWLFDDAKPLRFAAIRHDLTTIHNEILAQCDVHPLKDGDLEEIDDKILKPSDLPEIRDPARQIAREIYCRSETLEQALDEVHELTGRSGYDDIIDRLSGPLNHPLAKRF